jgi:hypothetical protein
MFKTAYGVLICSRVRFTERGVMNKKRSIRREFRARRKSAAQVYPSGKSFIKGGIAMVKKLQTKFINFVPLLLAGWMAFGIGVYIDGPLALKLMLLSAARVLP